MNLPPELFPPAWHWLALALCVAVAVRVFARVPWKHLTQASHSSQRNLLFGFAVSLALMWSMKAGVHPGLNLHLLGAMAATLCLGAPLALLALALALSGIALNGEIAWTAWPINYVLMAIVPVVTASALKYFVESKLPPHFFIFVFVLTFVGSALTILIQGVVAVVALVLSGAYEWNFLLSEYLPYFMLIGFSEAWLSGAIVTLLVVYRPEWVAAFDDRRYLMGK